MLYCMCVRILLCFLRVQVRVYHTRQLSVSTSSVRAVLRPKEIPAGYMDSYKLYGQAQQYDQAQEGRIHSPTIGAPQTARPGACMSL